ncbi:MAG: hypothetical protein OQJ99_06015 [Rhodospirillales bacterium]|nr:hypothetical protein [Rhodospirillales bacterium]MCW9003130.1 hypothetical protein [Rhodospirillales bacterium]
MSNSAEAPETTKNELIRGEHPLAEGGLQSGIRYGLVIAAAGAAFIVGGIAMGSDDFTTIAGISLMALGLGSAGLLHILYR